MRLKITIILSIFFLIGSAYIIYMGRPVMKLKDTQEMNIVQTDFATSSDQSKDIVLVEEAQDEKKFAPLASQNNTKNTEEKIKSIFEDTDKENSKATETKPSVIQNNPLSSSTSTAETNKTSVDKPEAEAESEPKSEQKSETEPEPEIASKPKNTFTMAEVQSHASGGDCWSAINGTVYDLTTWVNQHPGGSTPILGLCGKDGSAQFNGQHGASSKPQSMLVLLKIGTLAQ